MPKFRYTGLDARTFPHVSLEVEPGAEVDADENPDPRFFAPTSKPSTPSTDEKDAD